MSKKRRPTRRQKVQRNFYEYEYEYERESSASTYTDTQIKPIKPKNYKQEIALSSITNNTLTILTGPPGTAKTLLATYSAVLLLDAKKIEKIYYVKPIVKTQADVGVGFLPGTLQEKTLYDIAPIEDSLKVFLQPQKAEYLISKKIIEFLPLTYLRGRSLNNCFIIADEMQNSTPESVFTVLTRLGYNSKICLIGDKIQRDMSKSYGLDGLSDLCSRVNYSSGDEIGHIKFNAEDCCRSGFTKKILNYYNDLYL